MKSIFIEQRQVLEVTCYREIKFQPKAGVGYSDEQLKILEEKRKCQFGYSKIMPNCQECRWFTLNNVSDGFSRALTSDEPITLEDISRLQIEYEARNKKNPMFPLIGQKEGG